MLLVQQQSVNKWHFDLKMHKDDVSNHNIRPTLLTKNMIPKTKIAHERNNH